MTTATKMDGSKKKRKAIERDDDDDGRFEEEDDQNGDAKRDFFFRTPHHPIERRDTHFPKEDGLDVPHSIFCVSHIYSLSPKFFSARKRRRRKIRARMKRRVGVIKRGAREMR